MELNDILVLMDRFDASQAAALTLEEGDWKLKLEKGAACAPAPAPAAPAPGPDQGAGKTLNSPLVGTFYAAPGPDAAPFVAVGDRVKKGQTVCVLEAMKMMSEVPAGMDCVIEEVLVKDGDLVGFDAPLFRVREL